ncbi:carboxypeptidase-like regulatory domain-containing protein, partial [bacterium]|nr:carboxypeptidase-like regulatory domain-containing protein [bacterium]
MKFPKVIVLLALLVMVGLNIAAAHVSVDPIGVAVSMDATDSTAVELILTNDGETNINFEIGFSSPPDDERRGAGPRRDDVEDLVVLIIMNSAGWGGEANRPAAEFLEIAEVEVINSGQIDDVNLDDYDLIVTSDDQDANYYNALNDNVEAFGEYVDGGGLMCFQVACNSGILSELPGDVSEDATTTDGVNVIEDDADRENPLIAGYLEDDEDDFPDELHGGSCSHGAFARADFVDNDAIDDPQIFYVTQNNANRVTVATYGFGSGMVAATSLTVSAHYNYFDNQNDWEAHQYSINQFLWADWIGPSWITANPEEGVIEANGEISLDLSFVTEEMEAGVYEMYVLIELAESDNRDDLDENLIMISAIMSVGTPIANVTGTITDAANDNPVEGAKLDVSGHYFARFTDENGAFSADNMPLGDYEVTISATDFLTTVEEINIEEDGDLEWNLALLHSECTPSERQFFMQLEPDYSYDFEFQIDNGGNGPLTYSAERRLLGDANAEPFELRQTDEIEDLTGDDMLAGAVFAEEQFFISGGNNGGNPNKIYILNADREVVGEFDQFVEDRYGMRDLAYDGELIWGAVEGTFFGFTTTGDLEIEFSVDVNLEGRAIAWDPIDQVLLASDISTDIFAINRDGDVVETYNRPAELRIYGLGVWPDDPDDCYLYVFCRGPDNVGINAFKLNPATGEYMLAQYFDVGDGRPGGIMITNQLDVYSWVIVALVQNPDRLNVWQLAARKEWFQVTPTAGVIEPDEHEGFVLTLDATGLPVDNDFCGEVVFMHDGIGQETALDVTLSVQEGRVQTTRDIDLHIGWNSISTNLQPNDNENIEGLVAAIVD